MAVGLIISTVLLSMEIISANPHVTIVTFFTNCTGKQPQFLESINCNGSPGFIRITGDKVKIKTLKGPLDKEKIEKNIYNTFSKLCNYEKICTKSFNHIPEIECQPTETAEEVEIEVDYLCIGKNESAENYTQNSSPPAPTTLPTTDKRNLQFSVFPTVMVGLAIFTLGAVFICAAIYIKGKFKKRKRDFRLDDAYAEIDYGQMSSASVTPDAPLPPTAGTPHPHLMPLQYYSTAREFGRASSKREGPRRKHKASRRTQSKRRRDDGPPNFIPPEPEAQQSPRLFRLKSPPQSFKKNPKGLDSSNADASDTLFEENCAYDLGGSSDILQVSPQGTCDKDSGLDNI